MDHGAGDTGAQNSFGSGGPAFACWDLGGTVAPVSVDSCTVKPGTKMFVAATSFECSTFEGNGTTEAELRTCARQSDVQVAPTVTVDGKSVPVGEVETPLLNITLPADNLFGLPSGTEGQSVAHGWVTLLNPLTTPGRRIRSSSKAVSPSSRPRSTSFSPALTLSVRGGASDP